MTKICNGNCQAELVPADNRWHLMMMDWYQLTIGDISWWWIGTSWLDRQWHLLRMDQYQVTRQAMTSLLNGWVSDISWGWTSTSWLNKQWHLMKMDCCRLTMTGSKKLLAMAADVNGEMKYGSRGEKQRASRSINCHVDNDNVWHHEVLARS